MLMSSSWLSTSAWRVLREHIVPRLHDRVARKPALGIVRLRRKARHIAGSERLGCSVIVEHRESPTAAVREPLGVLHHEVDIGERVRHGRIPRILALFRYLMDLRHLRAVGDGLAVAGNAGFERL